MNDDPDKQKVMIYHRKLSLRTKFGEYKGVIPIGLMVSFLFFVILFVSIAAAHTAIALVGLPVFMALSMTLQLVLGLGGVFALFRISRKLFFKDKMLLVALQEKSMAGASPLTLEETHQLIDCSLKLNHQLVSDFYSKQVMALSMLTTDAEKVQQNWMISSDCWASTAEFDKQWTNKMWVFFETHGILTLSQSVLHFQSKKFAFECSPSQIKSVEVRQIPFWAVPARPKYLYVTIDDSGCERCFLLRPSILGVDLVWDGDKKVEEWAKRIESVADKSFHPVLPS